MKPNDELLVSPFLSLVPFANFVDQSRLNMTSKQLSQVIINKDVDYPYCICKDYIYFTSTNDRYKHFAEEDGIVLFNEHIHGNTVIIIYYLNSKKTFSFNLPDYKQLSTYCIQIDYIIKSKKFKKGDTIFCYKSIDLDTKIPMLGHRAKIAFMPFFGYNVEDAIVLSESFANKLSHTVNESFVIPISSQLKYFKNSTGKYLPNNSSIADGNLMQIDPITMGSTLFGEIKNISNKASIFYGTKHTCNIGSSIYTMKVHKITKKSAEDLKATSYLIQPELIDELENNIAKLEKLKDSIKKRNKTLISYNEKFFDKIWNTFVTSNSQRSFKLKDLCNTYSIEQNSVDYVLEIRTVSTLKFELGDKLTNLFAGKGVVSKIIPDKYMPDNIDVVFNLCAIPARNNWGVIYEAALGKICEYTQKNVDNLYEIVKFINEEFIKNEDADYYNDINVILNDPALVEKMQEDVKKKGFYIFINSFSKFTYEDFYNFVKKFQEKFKVNILEKEKIIFSKEFIDYIKNEVGINSGIEYDSEISVEAYIGYNYILQLHHTSESKFFFCNFSSGYKKSNGQPIKGRSNNGGLHFSWQSLNSLLSHDANNVLKELYTIKSDAINDKQDYQLNKIVAGKYNLKNKYESYTKETIRSALKMIGLDFIDSNQEVCDQKDNEKEIEGKTG